MVTALQMARQIRRPSPGMPATAAGQPPVFMTLPTTIARKAIKLYHQKGAVASRKYVRASKLASWAQHTNASMATGARNVIDGLDAYYVADRVDGRTMESLGRTAVVQLPSGPVKVLVDVVLEDGSALAARAVFWDGPDFQPAQAPLLAAVYSAAMSQLYPERKISSIGIWQGRRQTRAEISFRAAQAQLANANRIRSAL